MAFTPKLTCGQGLVRGLAPRPTNHRRIAVSRCITRDTAVTGSCGAKPTAGAGQLKCREGATATRFGAIFRTLTSWLFQPQSFERHALEFVQPWNDCEIGLLRTQPASLYSPRRAGLELALMHARPSSHRSRGSFVPRPGMPRQGLVFFVLRHRTISDTVPWRGLIWLCLAASPQCRSRRPGLQLERHEARASCQAKSRCSEERDIVDSPLLLLFQC